MNYQWARDTVLKLIDRYSVAGNTIALSYNNQADFVSKIPVFLNDALSVIAATGRKLRKCIILDDLTWEERGGMRIYALPEDCMRVCMPHVTGAWLCDERHLAVPVGTEKDVLFIYYRRPVMLGDDPAPDMPLDGTVEMQMALPYYAAAQLVLHEDEFAYKALIGEWERHLNRLTDLPRAEMGVTCDDYWEGGG